MAYVFRHHVKMTHISRGYDAFLNLDKEMITKAPIVDAKSNLKLTQMYLDQVHISYQCDTIKINYALVYRFLLKIVTNMDGYV